VLEEILENGYHCVAIGSKIVSCGNLLEWRLSFSQAELKLVATMNHTQFLVYGLLKIFLKEIINHGVEEPLLCSYFLKTTVFWMIQVGSVEWQPNNLLISFWKCFKYLIQCIYRGEFPNFFIPQNNMFINKVVGAARTALLEQLYGYYNMDVSCLLLSPTLRSILEPELSSRTLVVPSFDGCDKAVVDLDRVAFQEINDVWFIDDKRRYFILLSAREKLSRLSLSQFQALTLQCYLADILVGKAFVMVQSVSCTQCKQVYKLDRIVCNMLKLASRVGCVSHSLYLALYYYRTGKYNEALRVTYLIKQRLSQHYIMYCAHILDRQRYIEAVGSLSLSRRMKRAWVNAITLDCKVHYIEECILEQYVILQNCERFLYISPFVLTDMLLVLSHYRLGDRSQALQSLTDLQTLLVYDEGRYVLFRDRNMSWQILGICQNVVGDVNGALQSYQESLRQAPIQKIERATETRIASLFDEGHLQRHPQP
jgi:hypothetical protein